MLDLDGTEHFELQPSDATGLKRVKTDISAQRDVINDRDSEIICRIRNILNRFMCSVF